MRAQNIFHGLEFFGGIPMIDGDFDRFESNSDLENQLRPSEKSGFYHKDLTNEE